MSHLNTCQRCGHVWQPRVRIIAAKCPDCGSRDVTLVQSTEGAPAASGFVTVLLAIVAVLAIILVGGLLAFGGRKNEELAQAAKNTTTQVDAPPKTEKSGARSPSVAGTRDDVGKNVSTPKEEVKRPEVPKLIDQPAVELSIAPVPRRAVRNRPPTCTPTEWVRNERVQTRVLGARVVKPYLTNDAGDEFSAVEPVLVIWVETQNLTASQVSLRRWLNPVTEDASLWVSGERVPTAKIPSGTRILDQLVGEHTLSPGGPSAVDLLAFHRPKSDKSLLLQLVGSHVGEAGVFKHHIPFEMWKDH